jgi:PEP-CTERM motif
MGGGKPQPGIGVGETATFYFNLTGTGISSLGATDFASNNNFAAVRFRGFADGGSDKVTGGGGGGAQVPEPATIFLLGSGLLGLFGFRKKIRKTDS